MTPEQLKQLYSMMNMASMYLEAPSATRVEEIVTPDPPIHNDIGFCYDMGHECHENLESINELQDYYQDGLVSEDDRDNIYHGKTI